MVVDAPIGVPVLAITAWPDNAAMVEDCVRLGYLRATDRVLDPTYGRGTWWKRWRPARLVWCTHDTADFRHLPFAADTFDSAVFDPPYISKGRATKKLGDFDQRYGLAAYAAGTPRQSPAEVQRIMDDGLTDVVRVVKPGGFVLVKCMDYISGGKLWQGVYKTVSHALALGCEVQDRFEHLRAPGPQPAGRPQKHARRNHSTLLVLRTPS